VVEITPFSASNGGSMHQKQPPANVAVAGWADCSARGADVVMNTTARATPTPSFAPPHITVLLITSP
jgi:hypothetical protein